MQIVDLLLIAVGLSMDAFAVSVCKGLSTSRINWRQAFIIALSFGIFQAGMPLIGWFLGSSVQALIEPVDHWIAFVLLAGIGAKMLWDAFTEDDDCPDCEPESKRGFIVELLALSVATSIDALVAGISFSMANIDILPVVCVIGITTFTLALTGFVVGNRFGAKFRKPATILGGAALILLGIKILLEHLL